MAEAAPHSDGPVIAVDGAAGSGKSSTSRAVAARLGLRYLDTGAMYRAVTWSVLQAGVPLDDAEAVARHAATVGLRVGTDPGHEVVDVGGADVREEIRSAPVTSAVSQVSAVPGVRRLMVKRQRALIGGGGIVVEGRDIGTVVATDADLKVFLTADARTRASRRAAQIEPVADRGMAGSREGANEVAAVEADLARRDAADSSRAVSPLTRASDAFVVDTSERCLDEVVDEIVALVRSRAVSLAR